MLKLMGKKIFTILRSNFLLIKTCVNVSLRGGAWVILLTGDASVSTVKIPLLIKLLP